MDPLIARKTFRTLEPIHAIVYFAPEAAEEYARCGIAGGSGYFASRSAPMGAVSAELVVATFFNFEPGVVRRALDGVWDTVTPAELIAARFRAAAAALRRTAGELADGPDVAEAASIARVAAEEASRHLAGKPLFAGHATVAWPEDPLLVLWHAQSLLREFRGDIHVAALTAAGLDGCEALVTHAATREVPAAVLQSTRGWSDDQWAAAVAALRAKGHVDAGGAFTEQGRASRQWIEDHTDAAAVVAYDAIGEEACTRLRSLCRPLAKAVVANGGLGGR